LRYLKQWYGASYDDDKVAANYPRRGEAVARGWLASEHPAVRLVAVEALARAQAPPALPQLIAALADPDLINPHLAYNGRHEVLGLRLRDFGYRYYMSKEQRAKPLADLHARFSQASEPRSR